MKTILLIGACGSGKTWVMKELIRILKLDIGASYGMVRYKRNAKVLVLGGYDGTTFEGSDRLSMAVMRDVPEFLEDCRDKKYKFIICEGDRFSCSTFVAEASPYVIRITDDGSKGRKLRGSEQSERHIKSIETRVRNMVADVEVSTSLEALKLIRKLTS